jgi:hypothetical protein
MPQPQNLVVLSVWLTQAVTLSRSAWWQVCECMRDSTRDKLCLKWWLRSRNGLIMLHHEERNCWIRKNERSLLEILMTGRGVEGRQLLQKWSDVCHRGHGVAPGCVSSIKVHIRIHRTCNQGVVSDSNQIIKRIGRCTVTSRPPCILLINNND